MLGGGLIPFANSIWQLFAEEKKDVVRGIACALGKDEVIKDFLSKTQRLSMQLHKAIFTAILMAGPVCVPAVQAQEAQAQASQVARMTVSGEARVTATPDLSSVSLGAEGRGQTAVEAMDATTQALDGIIARLTEMGIEEKDIQTRDLSVNEETRWNRERDEQIFVGYLARNMVEVRVRDMDLLSDVLGQVLGEGANRLGGISFEMQDDAPLRAEARREAVTDAMEKARLFAEAAGVEVGRVLSIDDTAEPLVEGPRMRMAEPMMMEDGQAKAVPVAVGEVTVRAEVTMVFEIAQ